MSSYPPMPKPWHDSVGMVQECECDEAYHGRGLVDPHCWYHETIDTIEVLREQGWVVEDEVVCMVETEVTFDTPEPGDQSYTLPQVSVPYPGHYLIVPTEEAK